jgi:hypothetical protein
MSSINKQRSQQNTHLLTLDCMLANAVLNTIPLAVDCQPCNLPTIFHLPLVLELVFITTTFCIVPATHLEKTFHLSQSCSESNVNFNLEKMWMGTILATTPFISFHWS